MVTRIKNKLKCILNCFMQSKISKDDIYYDIGPYKIKLPYTHQLPHYQERFKNYDKKLGLILSAVEQSCTLNTIIDVGANVGDTAALIRCYTDAQILCIEGDVEFISYLKANANMISNVIISECYVGDNKEVRGEIERANGTARINSSGSSESRIQLKLIEEVLKENNLVNNQINFIKIDTDGFDFSLIMNHKNLISESLPHMFFEYDICFNDEDKLKSLEVISFLEGCGYVFIIYDNFGNLMDYCDKDINQRFTFLNEFILSSRKNGGGVYYLDIFASTDAKIAQNIIQEDRLLVT